MREFVGHKMQMTIEQKGDIEGVMVSENKTFVFLKESDGRIHRYAKGKVCGFVPMDFEPLEYVPFHMLRCWNKGKGCPGVQLIQEGSGVKVGDFEVFMAQCECRDETCDHGTKGELRTVDGAFLREVFKDVLFGDYPIGKEADSGGSTSIDEQAGDGQDEGGRAGEGEVQTDGGTGSDQEAPDGA